MTTPEQTRTKPLIFDYGRPDEWGGWRTAPVDGEPSAWTLTAPSGDILYHDARGFFLTLRQLREAKRAHYQFEFDYYKRNVEGKRRAALEVARLDALLQNSSPTGR